MSAAEGRLTVVGAGEGLGARVEQGIARATQYLLATQHARGYWQAPLEANVTMEARVRLLQPPPRAREARHRAAPRRAPARPPAGGRQLAALARRPGPPLEHDRGLLRAQARRPRRRGAGARARARLHPRAGRPRPRRRLHAHLALATSGSFPRPACRRCRSSSSSCRRGSRSTSTRCRAGRAGPSCRSTLLMAHRPDVRAPAGRRRRRALAQHAAARGPRLPRSPELVTLAELLPRRRPRR